MIPAVYKHQPVTVQPVYARQVVQTLVCDGTVFDRSTKPLDGRIGQLVPGVSAGLQLVRIGGRATIYIPPRLGYGQARVGSLPENASLIFDVELLPR